MFAKFLNKYNVIFLNVHQFLLRAKKQNVMDYLEQVVINEIREIYGELFSAQETILTAVLE